MKRSPLVTMMCDASPAMADDGRQLVFQPAELECIIPVAGPGVVRLGGDQVTACHQFVALDGGVEVDGPLTLLLISSPGSPIWQSPLNWGTPCGGCYPTQSLPMRG